LEFLAPIFLWSVKEWIGQGWSGGEWVVVIRGNIYLYLYLHIYVYVYIYIYMCICMCMCTCMCKYMDTNKCIP
jgi:hypothetical protein